ncbi:MAG TPA: NBR1-Ig-like domain-containing protein [Blastocatellia bacterium]|nr:NBR1-Ig-like domain-containing protein [Blastocatellia bacterium]
MAKRKVRGRSAPGARRRGKAKWIWLAGLLFALGTVGMVLAWRGSSGGPAPNLEPQAGSLSPANPAKEYIYAGGRLAATEEPAAAPNSARFVSQNVPSQMVAGQSYSVSVTMNNSGTNTWTTANYHRLGSQNPQDNMTWGVLRVDFPASVSSVPPGANVTFTFTVTAPATPGTYNFQWRMVQEFIEWFGEFSQNVSVNVTPRPNSAQFISQSVPTSMTAGQSYSVSVTMKNVGTNTWDSDYRLGSQNPQDNRTWGLHRVLVPATVSPGASVTFTFTVTAPATPGTHNFQWRMVQELIEWFGDFSPNVPVNVTPP